MASRLQRMLWQAPIALSGTSKCLERSGPAGPIARASFLVRQRNDHYLGVGRAVEYAEWESLKDELARSVFGCRIARRSVPDSGHGLVNGVSECCGT